MTAVGTEQNRRERLARELLRYRSRMIVVAGSRYAVSSVTVALAVAVGVSLAGKISAPAAGGLGAALVAVAALASFIVASVSAPSLAQTASRLDRRLGSNDCLVTAVECLAASDPVADLVVREAQRRLESSTPSTLLPLELPQRFGMLSAVASTIVVVSIILWNRSTISLSRPTAPSASTNGANPAADRSVPSGRGQRQSAANAQDASTTAAAPAGAAAGASEPTADRSRAADTDSAAAKNGADSGRGTAADRSNALPSDPSRAPSESASGASADRHATTTAGGSRSDSPSARGDRGTASGAQSGSGGGRSASLASQTARGAGGVSGGSLSNAPAGDRAGAPSSSPRSAVRMDEAAWTRAQAVIARERIPADLRQLVQDYFTAIRRARR